MLLGTLGASLLRNILTGKGAIPKSHGQVINRARKGQGINRAGEGILRASHGSRFSKMDF